MKKVLLIALPIIVSALVGFFVFIGFFISWNNEVVYAESFTCVETITLKKGDSKVFSKSNYQILPYNCSFSPTFASENSNIVEIDAYSGQMQAHEIGTCAITVSVKSGEEAFIEKQIFVTVEMNEILPEDVSVANQNITLQKDAEIKLSILFIGENNVLPTYAIQNSNIAYNAETSIIKGLKVGTDVLSLIYKLSNGETKTITINVTITEENITNESVEISLSATKPQIIQFNFENVTADFEPQISSGELHIEILFYDFNTMTIKPISKGTAVIVVNSGTAIKIYTITVID